LQQVKKGESFVVTSHGKPVARITPVDEHGNVAERARKVLFASLEAAPVRNIGRWTRDELYEQ
jgi:prevent-host-death family protein